MKLTPPFSVRANSHPQSASSRTVLAALVVGAAGAALLATNLTAGAGYLGLLPGLLLVGIGDGTMFTAIFIAAATGVAHLLLHGGQKA